MWCSVRILYNWQIIRLQPLDLALYVGSSGLAKDSIPLISVHKSPPQSILDFMLVM
jgi:hypothetical protein